MFFCSEDCFLLPSNVRIYSVVCSCIIKINHVFQGTAELLMVEVGREVGIEKIKELKSDKTSVVVDIYHFIFQQLAGVLSEPLGSLNETSLRRLEEYSLHH